MASGRKEKNFLGELSEMRLGKQAETPSKDATQNNLIQRECGNQVGEIRKNGKEDLNRA